MRLSEFPKDVLVTLALELDLEEIIRLCQTSQVFNEKICKNDNFWLNKLIEEYGVTKSLKEAKREYLLTKNLLDTDPNRVLNVGIKTENFKMVKAAVESGADLEKKISLFYPISLSLAFDDPSILNYLLEKRLPSVENVITIIKNMLDMFETPFHKDVKCKMFISFYSIFLPYFSKIVDNNKYKSFWIQSRLKLEEIYKNPDVKCIDKDFYDKWIGFYKKLA